MAAVIVAAVAAVIVAALVRVVAAVAVVRVLAASVLRLLVGGPTFDIQEAKIQDLERIITVHVGPHSDICPRAATFLRLIVG